MTKRQVLLFAGFVAVGTAFSMGQINCPANSARLPLVCLLPNSSSFLNSSGQIGTAAALNAALPINASIGAQLTQLPIPSGAIGTITLLEKGNPAGRPFDNLGPILTERPDTIGKGRFYTAFTYQHFNFNAINGIGLGSLSFGYNVPTATQIFYGSNKDSVEFQLNQYVAIATYGATRTTDVSVVLPFNSVSLSATASNFVSYVYDFSLNKYSPTSPIDQTPVRIPGSASGIGDIIFNVKQLLYGQEETPSGPQGHSFAAAAGIAVRIPSGDAFNYLGSGAYGANIYGLMSYRSYNSRLSPHFKLGYQWNGASVLVNPTAATHGNARLPGGLQYAVGTDARILRNLTFAIDLLGSQFVNSASLTLRTPITLIPTPSTSNSPLGVTIPPTLAVAQPMNSSYTTFDLSTGLKWSPIPHLLVYGNVLIQMNNVGLRSDPVPLAGISYNFGPKE